MDPSLPLPLPLLLSTPIMFLDTFPVRLGAFALLVGIASAYPPHMQAHGAHPTWTTLGQISPFSRAQEEYLRRQFPRAVIPKRRNAEPQPPASSPTPPMVALKLANGMTLSVPADSLLGNSTEIQPRQDDFEEPMPVPASAPPMTPEQKKQMEQKQAAASAISIILFLGMACWMWNEIGHVSPRQASETFHHEPFFSGRGRDFPVHSDRWHSSF